MRGPNVLLNHADGQTGGFDHSRTRSHVPAEQAIDLCNRWNLRLFLRNKPGLVPDQRSRHSLRDRWDRWGWWGDDIVQAGHELLCDLLLQDRDPAWLLIIHDHQHDSPEQVRQYRWPVLRGR